jgi:molybdopterin-guanine dinucleotide biosynthesis protein MobB
VSGELQVRVGMKFVAVVGDSNTGKTRLIERLILELKARGSRAAVIKHCGHGFAIGGRNKDSSRFLAAGAIGVALAASDRHAVIKEGSLRAGISGSGRKWFHEADVIFIEGGRKEERLKKIEVLRRGRSASLRSPARELAAVVADFSIEAGVPVFHPDDVRDIADWLLGGF